MILEKEASPLRKKLNISQQVVFILKKLFYRVYELIEAYILIQYSTKITTKCGPWLVYYGNGLPLLLRLLNTFLIVLFNYFDEFVLLNDLF
jgi:DNA integrity scanning protein DisA with diadenylate cyclase activity